MEEKIEGIFCKEKWARIGTGHTSRRTLQKTYWHVESSSDVFLAWPITPNGDKVGVPDTIDKMNFGKSFIPEFSYPKEKEITKKDISLFRTLFLIQAEYKEKESAIRLIETLLQLKERFPVDVPLGLFFLELGAIFRKASLFDVALLCYKDVKELGLNNAALYFNIARVYFDMKDYKQCIHNLKESYGRSNGNTESIRQLLEYMQKNELIPEGCEDDITSML